MHISKRQKQVLAAVIVPFQVTGAVQAWRDMSTRDDDQVRGSKKFWRVVVSLNPGNSLLYWLFGRR